MPTIEVYSVKKKHIQALTESIGEWLGDAEYADKIVITWVRSKVFDLNGTRKPFFRIVMTYDVDVQNDIVTRLSNLGMDIELAPPLNKFIEGKLEKIDLGWGIPLLLFTKK